ncbi:MAG: hypothetical protein DRN06_02540 [Thermoprotei archaeon]|nr:MAG: hypothetical protein DRN06_02540 [Thermoprotei archaeon]
MMVLDSRALLDSLGYEYAYSEEPGSEPLRTGVKFAELLPQLSSDWLGGERLYEHQLKALEALEDGKNLLLIAGTGSGKTEAWFLYAARNGRRVLALYPTLALSNDQVQRLARYCRLLGTELAQVDSPTLQAHSRAKRRRELRMRVRRSLVTVSNPAFLLQDLKRHASSPSKSFIVRELHSFDLLVLDELDFYSPRELALIFGMLRIFAEMGWKPQVAVLTATLSNPEELAQMLKEVNGRDSAIVTGRPFKVSNRVYVVLGKDLEKVRRSLLQRLEEVRRLRLGPDVEEAILDPKAFRENAYRILPILKSAGLDVEQPHADPLEILAHYVDDDGVTLVFTRSIGKAEELARRLKQTLPRERAGMIAAHHHLVSKSARERIEEGARRGEVKLIFTPRTLVQGIDIGSVVRIVHVGLPDDVREFWQREGRKGRRRGIPFTETVIFPSSKWDRELLSRGLSALQKWMSLPLEKAVVNRDNKYTLLFTGLFKLVATRSLGLRVSEEELKLLHELRLARGRELTVRGRRVWQRLNFYEFGPPYGVKRMKLLEGRVEYLQEASHVDVVEKLQPGCFDFTSDFLVTNLRVAKGRWVTVVEEERATGYTLYRHEFLAQAYEEYRKVKSKWGEEPNLWRDYLRGSLRSRVVCTLHPPISGFGRYLEVPYRVVWIVESDKIRPIVVGGRTYAYRLRRVVDVPSTTMGRYEDYSYGRMYELDPQIDLNLARLGLALIKVVLRRVFRIGLKRISYDLSSVGGRKLLVLFEDDSAGLIEKLDWLEVRGAVESYEPDELDEVLVEVVDEMAHMKLVETGFRWDIAKAHALAVLDTIVSSERLRLKLRGIEVTVPRPSRALKLLSLDVLRLPLTEEGDVALTFVALYDGEEAESFRLLKEFYLIDKGASAVMQRVASYLDEGYSLVVHGLERVAADLERGGLMGMKALIKGLVGEGRIHDTSQLLREVAGVEVGADEVASYLGFEVTYTLDDVRREHEESLRRIRSLPYSKWLSFTQYLSRKAQAYLEERARNIYLIHLALKSVREGGIELAVGEAAA